MAKWIDRLQWQEMASFGPRLTYGFIPAVSGLLYKYAQYEGRYPASPSVSLTLSELLKLLFFFGLLSWKLAGTYGSINETLSMKDYQPQPRADSTDDLPRVGKSLQGLPRGVRKAIKTLRGDEVWESKYELGIHSICQFAASNTAFTSYQVADAGTVQLFKLSIPLIVGWIISAIWTSSARIKSFTYALLLVSGLAKTQLTFNIDIFYSFQVYIILFLHAFLAEAVPRHENAVSENPELNHYAKTILASAIGATLNLSLHIVLRCLNVDEPGFFDGYWLPGACLILIGNACIGFITSLPSGGIDMPTRLLLSIPAVIFLQWYSVFVSETQFSLFVVAGNLLVFSMSWKYFKDSTESSPTDKLPSLSRLPKQRFRLKGIVLFLAATALLVCVRQSGAALSLPPLPNPYSVDMCVPPPTNQVPSFHPVDYPQESIGSGLKASDALISSPFQSTMAIIRWNGRRVERVPLLMKYAPFFHTVHISMPDMLAEESQAFHNLTHDQYPDGERIYIQLARTMQLILDEQPQITGLLYFHFDAWIDPLAWDGFNAKNIWLASTGNTRINSHLIGGPRFTCMTDPSGYPGWWGWQRGWHKKALSAIKTLLDLDLGYKARDDEWCLGWSDMYYIPRRFFADYILLTHVFGCEDVFHEVAVPTMLHVIDQSRRQSPFRPVLDRVGDCWGGCCDSSARPEDVLWTRCGHRLDYLNKGVVEAQYGRLEREAKALGKPVDAFMGP